MSENNKKILIGGLVVLVVVVLLAWYFGKGSGVNYKAGIGAAGGTAGGTAATGGAAQSATMQPVGAGVSVPGATSTVSANVAKPVIVTQAAPGASSNFRSFTIQVSGNEFKPNTVIANVGDTVHLNITAADKDYDFYQPDNGLSMPLPKGITKVVEFQAPAPFKYTFYCKSCGGPSKGPVGYITVVPKN